VENQLWRNSKGVSKFIAIAIACLGFESLIPGTQRAAAGNITANARVGIPRLGRSHLRATFRSQERFCVSTDGSRLRNRVEQGVC
jgi:hypothetical protein